MIQQLFTAFGDVPTSLERDNLATSTSSKLLEIINYPVKFRKLRIELAIIVDAMEPLVKATYILEGDAALALVTYENLSISHLN